MSERSNHEGHRVGYSSKHDARFCLDCDVWLERKCGDECCFYCNRRPDTPGLDVDVLVEYQERFDLELEVFETEEV